MPFHMGSMAFHGIPWHLAVLFYALYAIRTHLRSTNRADGAAISRNCLKIEKKTAPTTYRRQKEEERIVAFTLN